MPRMTSTKISRRARDFALYTGAPRQLACDVVKTLDPHRPLIPAPAEQDQLLLESEALYLIMASQRAYSEYPFGIAYVEPSPFGLRLHLENTASADTLLKALLPSFEPRHSGNEIQGLHGVRICGRTAHGVELRRIGQPTSLTLTGPRRVFERAEAELLRDVQQAGGLACWRSTEAWTDQEIRWDAEREPLIYQPTWRAGAWLPSGLLRRIGLLHTVAVPHVVTGHESQLGELWVLRLEHNFETSLRRADLVRALTDPTHGMPLQLADHCDLQPGRSLGLVLLKALDGTSALQLRYDRSAMLTRGRTELFEAIERRITAVTNEAELALLAMGGSVT